MAAGPARGSPRSASFAALVAALLPRSPLVVPDHLFDYEADELLTEFRIKIGIDCQRAEPFDLAGFAAGVAGGKPRLCLVFAYRLRDAEPLG